MLYPAPSEACAPSRRERLVEWLREAPSPRFARRTLIGMVAFFLLLIMTYYPGVYIWDTLEQARQGEARLYTNLFPPFYSWLLGWFTRTFGTPAPQFFPQMLAFYGPLFILLRRSTTRGAALLIVFAFVGPNFWTLGTQATKDTWVAALLLWCVVLAERGRPATARTALVLLVLMTLFRHNAMAFAVPLAIIPSIQAASTLPRRLAVFAVTAAFCVTGPKIVEKLLDVQDVWPFGYTAVFDTVALYVAHPEEYERGVVGPWNPKQELLGRFDACTVWDLANSPDLKGMSYRDVWLYRKELGAERMRLIKAHPIDFLKFRWRHFSCILRLGEDKPFAPYLRRTGRYNVNFWQVRNGTHTPQWAMMDGFRGVAAMWTPLFMPKWWFLGLLVALPLLVVAAWKRRPTARALPLVLAALLYCFSFFIAGPAADHRYMVPVELSLLLTCWIVLQARNPPSTRAPSAVSAI